MHRVATAAWDGADLAAFAGICATWQPRWIVHCGPLSAASWDPSDRGFSAKAEPQIAAKLAEISHDSGARLAVLSSDAVFAGPRMFHEESFPTDNTTPRAVLIRNMERALEDSGVLVVRTHAFGWSPVAAHADFAELTACRLADRQELEADGRRYATPILASDLADLLWRAYELRLCGLYHLAGAERTTRVSICVGIGRGTRPRQALGQSVAVATGCRRARRNVAQ